MNNLIYLEIDIFASIVLAVIVDYTKWKYLNSEQKFFNLAVISTVGVLVCDALSWGWNGQMGPLAFTMNLFGNYMYWIASIFPGYFAMLYALTKVNHPRFRLYKKLGLVPIALSMALLGMNQLNHWIFSINEKNIYGRGDYFYFVGFLPFFYIGICVIVTLVQFVKAPHYEKKSYGMSLLFMSIAFFGSLPQIFFYGIVTVWVAVALDLLMCYVYLQSGNMATDALTQLNNRRRFDVYAQYTCDEIKEPDDNMYLVILDLNKFKYINDNFGHAEGDRALCIAANVIQQVLCDGKTFFARIGGDEFAIIFRNVEEETVNKKIEELREALAKRCQDEHLEYDIEFAIGYSRSRGEHKRDFNKVFTIADKKMYEDKRDLEKQRLLRYMQPTTAMPQYMHMI